MKLQALLDHPDVRGVCIGCCVDGKPLSTDYDAHAHLYIEGERYPGFICFRTERALAGVNPIKVGRTSIHELAHLIANQHHSEAWRNTMRQLGQPIPAAYRRKPKRRAN